MANFNLASIIGEFVQNVTRQNGIVVNEYLIEQYVRFRDKMDTATQVVVKEYINKYASAAAIASYYTQFYEELDKADAQPPTHVRAFVAFVFVLGSVAVVLPSWVRLFPPDVSL